MNVQRLLLGASLSVVPVTALLAFSSGPLPRFTGGSQEETCVSCHNSFPLNEGRTRGGDFNISGVPESYRGGESYPITVLIGQPDQSRWGFQPIALMSSSVKTVVDSTIRIFLGFSPSPTKASSDPQAAPASAASRPITMMA